MPHKIVYLIEQLGVGGTEENVIAYARNLDRDRFAPVVFCLNPGPRDAWLRHSGINLIVGSRARGWEIGAPFRLYRFLRRERPTIVHCVRTPSTYLGVVIGRLARVPVLVNSLWDYGVWKHWPQLFWDRLVSGNVDLQLADGRGLAEYARRQQELAPGSITVHYDGVDPRTIATTQERSVIRRQLDIPIGAIAVGVIARLVDKKKGQADFLRALQRLLPTMPAIFGVLVGDGRDREQLRQLADTLGVAHRLRFEPTRTDLGNVLAGLDIVVIPSRWESVPKILLEAMAAGKPVIATTVGDVGEFIVSGTNGLLVPPGDPAALASAIAQLAHDQTARDRLGAEARQTIERRELWLPQTMRRLESHYHDQLQRRSGAPPKLRHRLRVTLGLPLLIGNYGLHKIGDRLYELPSFKPAWVYRALRATLNRLAKLT